MSSTLIIADVDGRSTLASATPRRQFIRLGTMTCLAVGVAMNAPVLAFGQEGHPKRNLPPYFDIPKEALNDPVASLSSSKFEPYLWQWFRILKNGLEPADIRLIEISERTSPIAIRTAKIGDTDAAAVKASADSFSIVFFGYRPQLKQEVYTFKHAVLGTFDLLLVPIGKDQTGFYYEAVFNRLVKRGR